MRDAAVVLSEIVPENKQLNIIVIESYYKIREAEEINNSYVLCLFN